MLPFATLLLMILSCKSSQDKATAFVTDPDEPALLESCSKIAFAENCQLKTAN